jgi:flagellar basal-body rod modification protein FlgD
VTSIDPATTLGALGGTTANPAGGSASASQVAPPAGSGSSNPLNQLDNTQTFLQLLVAQLENQDPLNPTDPTSFMTEISQLTSVEAQTTLANEQQVTAADSMLGKLVTGLDASGDSVTGVVSGVLLSSSGAPELTVGPDGTAVALTSVTKVAEQAGTSTGTSGASTSTSTPAGTASTSTPAGTTASSTSGS